MVGETVHGCVSCGTPAIDDDMGVLDLGTNEGAETEKPLSKYDLRTWNVTVNGTP